ncbi:inner membrane protein import complex subunit Tim54-domain-containing protein [Phakopsora pachyrhizi]|uniref:Mitochondrial import inner membrane translocase subunit TIM54 n=1 Tax=Phakopsora pachyrhizi TaxID=170000 RepID=A0AAV0BEQ6_PHAPC|nr:inner membrane protein import complex subunit Tim54-domain-containing protein [Phakopsora pachyrhizi]
MGSASDSRLSKPIEINPAFRYVGIPSSWLRSKTFRLPSRKTSAFLLFSTSLVSLYVYDRNQCRKIREDCVQRVRRISEELVTDANGGVGWMPRSVKVYGARIPEDVEVDRAAQWFKKFIKPILVAAAIDYTIINGTSPGSLGRKIAGEIQAERVIQAAQEKDGIKNPQLRPGLPGYRDWHDKFVQPEGGTLVLGRASLKEFLWGIEKGFKEQIPLDGLDDDERFAQEINKEGIFEEPRSLEESDFGEHHLIPEGLRSVNEELKKAGENLDFENPTTPLFDQVSSQPSSSISLFSFFKKSVPSTPVVIPQSFQDEPRKLIGKHIPPQPPLLLVPFDHPIGIKWWPIKIYRFFNRREQAHRGAQAAMQLVNSNSQPIEPPSDITQTNHFSENFENFEDLDFSIKITGSSHLDFLTPKAERHIRSSYKKVAKNIMTERDAYRTDLKARLAKARELANSVENEAVLSEANGQSEVQLRQEAFQKEKKWKNDLEGWSIVRPGSKVCWDSDMIESLRVYSPSKEIDT